MAAEGKARRRHAIRLKRLRRGAALASGLHAALAASPCLAAGAAVDAAGYADIPAAAESTRDADVAAAAAAPLQLEIVVNGVPSGIIAPVWIVDGRHRISASDLRVLALPVEGEATALVTLEDLPGVSAEYDAPSQQLRLQAPADWLPELKIELGARRRIPARSSFGMMVNYDLYASDAPRAAPSASLWTDVRTFGPLGTLSTTATLSMHGGGSRLMRYDTRWTYSDERSMTTFEVGDLVTRTLPWSGAMRLGGVQISRDFSVRPDVVTYPTPAFAGRASLPSGVELFIDSHRAYSGAIRPGPFTLTPMPQLNGAGQASVVVTDALGRQTTTTIPFYVASTLLRPGLTDYAIAAGAVRRRYGRDSFAYGGWAASASLRHGLTSALTLEAHGEASDDLLVGGLGVVLRLGVLGVVDAAYSRSRAGGRDGGQVTIGYQYQRRGFSAMVRHVRRSAAFFDLAALDGRGGHRRMARQTSAAASLSLGRFGSLSAGYVEDGWRRGEEGGMAKTRLLNAGWSLPISGISTLTMAATRELSRTEGASRWTGSLGLLIPLGGRRGAVSGNVLRDRDGRVSARVDYTRSPPSQGGLGLRASVARLGDDGFYGNGDLTWRTRYAELRGGAFGGQGDFTRWLGASGSVIWIDDALIAANRVGDAFALVSTGGQPDVPVYYENQLVGRTDSRGRILAPWAASYYPAKYRIDPLDLPEDIGADVVEQQVAISRGAGYVLEFPVRKMVAARITLVDGEGQALAVGAVARINDRREAIVGWDGLLFAEDLLSENELIVRLPDGRSCRARFSLPSGGGGVADVGPLPCQ